MEFKEIFEQFFYIEKKLDLFSKQVHQIYFWEWIRFQVIDHILMINLPRTYPYTHLKVETNITNLVKTGLYSIVDMIIRNPFLTSEKDILFFGHPRRKFLSDGKWWDIYTDPIIQKLESSYELIENYYGNSHLKPAKTQNIKYLDFLQLIYFLKKIFRLNKICLTNEEKNFLKVIEEEFKSKFVFKLNLERITLNFLEMRKAFLPLFLNYLRKLNPKIVVVLISYSIHVKILIETAKKLKIPVIELQHGIIHPYHLAYSFPGLNERLYVFPDYLLTFGDYWNDSVSFPIPRRNIISVGYPFLENNLIKYKDIHKKNQILFISSVEYGEELTKLALELSQRVKNIKIVIKLHPGESFRWKKLYPWLKGSPIQVIDSDYPPLHKVLAESRILVGVTSTVIFEGLAFKLKTILLNCQWIEGVQHLIDRGYAKRISTVGDLLEELRNIETNQKIDVSYFFKSNSTTNILETFQSLISKN